MNFEILGWGLFIPFTIIAVTSFLKYFFGSLTKTEAILWVISLIGAAIGASLCL